MLTISHDLPSLMDLLEHGIVDHCRVSNIIYSNSVLAVSS
jgi:hypothetical protein